jgi:hypothetical protein
MVSRSARPTAPITASMSLPVAVLSPTAAIPTYSKPGD